jgi:hypothetical protein
VPALLQALMRLASLRRLGVLVLVLVALLAATSTASARELVQTKTRVGAFELPPLTRIGRLGYSSLEQHRGFSRLELRLCLRPAPLWSWPGNNPFRWRDPSGRDAEEWFLRNGNDLALGVAAAGLAPITLYAALTSGAGALALAAEAELSVAALIARLGWAASPAARLAGASLAAVAGGAKTCGDAEVGINSGPAARGAATIDTAALRFTQSSVKGTFSDGRTLRSTIDALKGPGGDALAREIPAIRIFEAGGVLKTLDNRRLLAFSEAGRAVPYTWASPAEIAAESWKLTATPQQMGGWFIRVK